MERVLTFSTPVGFSLLLAAFAVAAAVASGVPGQYSPGIANTVAVAAYIGWPLSAALVLSRRGTGRTAFRTYLCLNFAVVLVLNFLAPKLLPMISGGRGGGSSPVLLLVWLYGVFASVQIMWAGATELDHAEEGSCVPANRRVGTFLLFFFLPAGIWVLQPRLRKAISLEGE